MKRRVVLAEATTGLFLAGGLLTVLVGVMLCSIGQSEPLWADRTRTTTLICIFTIPLLAGITAIVAARRCRGLGQVAAIAGVGASHPAVVSGMAGSMWALAVWLVQVLVPLFVRQPTDPFPFTAALPWVQAWAGMVAGVWFGAWCGSRAKGNAKGPALALILFAAFYGATYLPGRLRLASPFRSPWYTPWIEPDPYPPLGHTQIAIGIALVCGAGLIALRRVQIGSIAVATLLFVVGAFCVNHAANQERYVPRGMSNGPLCRSIGWQTDFCVHPLAGPTGEAATQALAEVRNVIGDRWFVPPRLDQIDLSTPATHPVVALSYGADQATHLSNAVIGLSPQCENSPDGEAAWNLVTQWLMAQVKLSEPAPENPLSQVLRSDSEAQDQWVAAQLQAGKCA